LPAPEVNEHVMTHYSDLCTIHIVVVSVVLIFCSYFVCADSVNTSNGAFIDLTSSESTIEVGDSINIEGYIAPSLLARPGDRVLLQVTSPKQSRADAYYQLKVNNEGMFTIELQADAVGDWSFIARYNAYASSLISVKVIPRAKVKETEITLSGPFNRVFRGDFCQMSGWLRDTEGNGIAYRQVWYSFGLPLYSCASCGDDSRRIWQTGGVVTTDDIGYFEFQFPAHEKGIYAVKATFPGDEVYGQTESPILYPEVF